MIISILLKISLNLAVRLESISCEDVERRFIFFVRTESGLAARGMKTTEIKAILGLR
ncbi:hypothetical protein D3C81_1979530 [compost metagenome]